MISDASYPILCGVYQKKKKKTDGGCINQGQLNAAAAFGFAFPHFPSYDQTEVIPKWRVCTSSRAEMEAFIGCMEASICIIAIHSWIN